MNITTEQKLIDAIILQHKVQNKTLFKSVFFNLYFYLINLFREKIRRDSSTYNLSRLRSDLFRVYRKIWCNISQALRLKVCRCVRRCIFGVKKFFNILRYQDGSNRFKFNMKEENSSVDISYDILCWVNFNGTG